MTYTKDFGDHHFDGLVGHSAQEVNGRYIGGSKRDVPVNTYDGATIDYARNVESQQVYGGYWERYEIESYFGRANYDYKASMLLQRFFVRMHLQTSVQTTVGGTSHR